MHIELSSSAGAAMPAIPRDKLYVESFFELEIAKQVGRCPEVEAYISKRYGIPNFHALADRHFGCGANASLALLPRQIPTASVESITCYVLCRHLDLRLLVGAFSTDTFTPASIDKAAALKPCTFRWRETRAGAMVCDNKTQRLTSATLEQLNGRVIDSLETADGRSVLDYHRNHLSSSLGPVPTVDAASFFFQCLAQAGHKPEYCFVRDHNHQSVKVATSRIDFEAASERDVRPPAKWYYPLLFALFVDRMFLLETYENPRGSVSAARELFAQTADEILAETGLRPRVVKIPPLSKEMLYINSHVLEDGPAAIDRLCSLRSNQVVGGDILELAQEIARDVLNYGRKTMQ